MYKEHLVFKTPDNDKKIWRYMDSIRLFDILFRKKLYFSRADLLGDHYEGSYPKENIDDRNVHIVEFFQPEIIGNLSNKELIKAVAKFNKSWRHFIGVNCWCMSEYESSALWQIYGDYSKGLAIQSTIGRLKESLKKDIQDIYVGKVSYINYMSDKIPDDNKLHPFLYKRKSYEYENEIRAVTLLPNYVLENKSIVKIKREKGYSVNVDPEILIENIFIAPHCDSWQKNIIESIIKICGLNIRPKQSVLNNKALF